MHKLLEIVLIQMHNFTGVMFCKTVYIKKCVSFKEHNFTNVLLCVQNVLLLYRVLIKTVDLFI